MRFSTIILAAVLFGGCAHHTSTSASSGPKTYKNIIFMVPDGMGLADVTAARNHLYGTGGGRLSFESLPYIGYQQTYSRDSFITDSAAAASAWASGEKFDNGALSCHDRAPKDGRCDETRKHPQTILEVAKALGKRTALVVTSDITHATPAAFSSHASHRKCASEIFNEQLRIGVDVMLGGGIDVNEEPCLLPQTTENNASLAKAKAMGYEIIHTGAALEAAQSQKLIGLFQEGGLTPQVRKTEPSTEPTLAAMVRKALQLSEHETGFFMLIEGSQIDWANHKNDFAYQVGEMIDFDNAYKEVAAWMKDRDDTLVVVVADHETGGFAINGPKKSYANATNLEAAWTTLKHTAVDTIIWSNDPRFGGAKENSDLYMLIREAMRP